VTFNGASTPTKLPLPDPNQYAGLKPFADGVASLLDQYPTNEYNPEKAAAKLTAKGYTKGSDGFWADANGHLKLEIGGFEVSITPHFSSAKFARSSGETPPVSMRCSASANQ